MAAELSDREKVAYDLRKKGKTFKQIGRVLNCTKGGAWLLHRNAEKKLNSESSPYDGLSTRATNCLINFGLTDKESVARAIKSGALYPGVIINRYRSYGLKTHIEICKWLGLPDPTKK